MVEILSAHSEDRFAVSQTSPDRPPDHRFAAHGTSELAPAVSIAVTNDGAEWLGDFFGGSDGYSGIVHGLGGTTLFVVAGGVGYLLDVARPDGYKVVSMCPIRAVRLSTEPAFVILVGYTKLGAVGVEGELWVSERLVWDGFAEVRIASELVFARGFHAPTGRDVEICLDIHSGVVLSRR